MTIDCQLSLSVVNPADLAKLSVLSNPDYGSDDLERTLEAASPLVLPVRPSITAIITLTKIK